MTIATENLEETAKTAEVPVLAYFSASWCGPCKIFRPRIEAMANESEHFILVHIDVDEEPELTQDYNVMSVPTVVGIVSGEEVDRFTGAKSNVMVDEFIEGLIG